MRRLSTIAFLAVILLNVNFSCQTLCAANHISESHHSTKAQCHMDSGCKHTGSHCRLGSTEEGTSKDGAALLKCDCGAEKKLSTELKPIPPLSKIEDTLLGTLAYIEIPKSMASSSPSHPPHRPPKL